MAETNAFARLPLRRRVANSNAKTNQSQIIHNRNNITQLSKIFKLSGLNHVLACTARLLGSGFASGYRIPTGVQLIGVELALQAFLVGAHPGLESTNGVRLTFGM